MFRTRESTHVNVLTYSHLKRYIEVHKWLEGVGQEKKEEFNLHVGEMASYLLDFPFLLHILMALEVGLQGTPLIKDPLDAGVQA